MAPFCLSVGLFPGSKKESSLNWDKVDSHFSPLAALALPGPHWGRGPGEGQHIRFGSREHREKGPCLCGFSPLCSRACVALSQCPSCGASHRRVQPQGASRPLQGPAVFPDPGGLWLLLDSVTLSSSKRDKDWDLFTES